MRVGYREQQSAPRASQSKSDAPSQIESTTTVILSSSSGQMSGQLVKPNWRESPKARISPEVSALALGEGLTHVDHTPLSEQVLVAKGLAVLVCEQERSADLGSPDASGGRLHAFPFADLVLLRLEVEPQADSGCDKESSGFQREGLRVRCSVSQRSVEGSAPRETRRTPAWVRFCCFAPPAAGSAWLAATGCFELPGVGCCGGGTGVGDDHRLAPVENADRRTGAATGRAAAIRSWDAIVRESIVGRIEGINEGFRSETSPESKKIFLVPGFEREGWLDPRKC